jgi:predicted HTH domain antitoxin
VARKSLILDSWERRIFRFALRLPAPAKPQEAPENQGMCIPACKGIELSKIMTLTLPDDLLRATKLTEAELQIEFALALFRIERLTLGQAALLAGLPQLDFQRLLASREIPLHYGIEAMEQDLQRAKRINRA